MFSDFLTPWPLAVLPNVSAIISFCSDTKRSWDSDEYFYPIANNQTPSTYLRIILRKRTRVLTKLLVIFI